MSGEIGNTGQLIENLIRTKCVANKDSPLGTWEVPTSVLYDLLNAGDTEQREINEQHVLNLMVSTQVLCGLFILRTTTSSAKFVNFIRTFNQ